MEDLPFARIADLMPEFAVKDLHLGRTHDDDDVKENQVDISSGLRNIQISWETFYPFQTF